MIIPVRCFTCHKVLGNKWKYYKRKVQEHEDKIKNSKFSKENIVIEDKNEIYFNETYLGDILDELHITKICCRRHMLGHVDIIDLI